MCQKAYSRGETVKQITKTVEALAKEKDKHQKVKNQLNQVMKN
jgi:hypothetical protein